MRSITTRRPRAGNRAVRVGAALTLLAGGIVAPGLTTGPAVAADPVVIHQGPNFLHLPAPLSTSECLQAYKIRCYTPKQQHKVNGLDSLFRRGIDGRGRTIVIPMPFGSPTIRNDLAVFSSTFGLPQADLRIIEFGEIPPYDPTDFTRIEWAAATTLLTEWAHAYAPRAKIVIAATNVSEDQGVTGFPELFAAEDALMRAGIGDVFAHIETTGENTFPGYDQGDYSALLNLRGTFKRAVANKVTMLAATGDRGKSSNWPATDPLVTAVGSHQQLLNDRGRIVTPYTTWNDGFGAASGGGLSTVFGRPAFQDRAANVVGANRGTPDVSLGGGVDGSGWVYQTYGGVGGTGWSLYNGSGQNVAEFAGIVALANQLAGHRLGYLNPKLYRLTRHGYHGSGLIDVTAGDNTLPNKPGNIARRGFDLTTGVGAVDGAALVRALAR